ncbi:MAG: PAS domain S-box protein [Oceanospirillaceae bacterium]|nr:PAS domain S-box protein [Oceanospirillaceae bacterium]
MDYQKVPITQSIGVELLKRIFGVYCIAALLITLFQGWLEYAQTKDRVIQLMIEHQPAVEESLANAVWHLDQPLIDSLLKGIISQRIIVGVEIFTEKGEILASAGAITHATEFTNDAVGTDLISMQNAIHQDRYRHQFVLLDPTELSSEAIGLAVFHSANDVVIEEVQPRLISLVIAAIVKTAILWVVFIYFGQKLLSQPLLHLMAMVRKLPLDDSNRRETPKKTKLNELQLFEFALIDTAQKLELTLHSLRTSNEKLSKINIHLLRAVEQSPTLSVILTPDGQVEYATPSLGNLSGYSPAQIQGLFDKDLLKSIAFHDFVKQCHLGKTPDKNPASELSILDKNGQIVYLTANLSAVYSEQGNADNFLFSATNISKNKRLQLELKEKNEEQLHTIEHLKEARSQLVQSEKMASIGELSAGIAHEINNPIAFINSNTFTLGKYNEQLFQLIDCYREQLKEGLADHEKICKIEREIDYDFLRQDIREMTLESQEGLNRIKKIVADLLFFSRSNNNKFELYDLRKGIESTLSIAWHQLKNNTQIVKEFADIPEIECIPSQINQVLMNLLINASQSFADQGIITIKTIAAKDTIMVQVEDNGSGIEPAHLSKLFDPFFTTKEVGSGTGLGLSVSYGIIKKHRGEITVTSELGKGTCFTLTLPIKQPVPDTDL